MNVSPAAATAWQADIDFRGVADHVGHGRDQALFGVEDHAAAERFGNDVGTAEVKGLDEAERFPVLFVEVRLANRKLKTLGNDESSERAGAVVDAAGLKMPVVVAARDKDTSDGRLGPLNGILNTVLQSQNVGRARRIVAPASRRQDNQNEERAYPGEPRHEAPRIRLGSGAAGAAAETSYVVPLRRGHFH